ncbi:MAG: MerR family transcriptional regulator [Leptolyngbyaceae cyanobacterium RM1_406_9]|nr:MerR family transcriptional regulator [Leptolyngbyaceae cyanobacterium RM1_406_9]
MLSVSEVSKIFDVDRQTIKLWAKHYKEYLSNYASPEKGLGRHFTQLDIQVLALIHQYWEDQPDYENIKCLLSNEAYREDHYREFSLLHISLIQNPCENPYEGSEAWTQGFLIGGMVSKFHQIEIARSYRSAAENLISEVKDSSKPLDYAYPVLFLYRHCLELYLKIILNYAPLGKQVKIHELDELIKNIENRYQKKIPGWMKARLLDFHFLDPKSTSFRYIDAMPNEVSNLDEFWIDFEHLDLIIENLCSVFESFIDNETQNPN